ncbi:MAG: dienelactone hydrolase family protein [Pseudohongiellaceae bacterium]|nr:dienelactone hydrolase family protein [Pseudohongiellaceae bacterium]
MRLLRPLLFLLLLLPALSQAEERIITLDDGSEVLVFMFYPEFHGEGPWPLVVHMSGGKADEYVVRAQFWLGRELTSRGWAIAFPVSPDANAFFGDNAKKIPQIVQQLQEDPNIQDGKTLIAGVSNGGTSAIEIASHNPERYFGVVAVPGTVREDAQLGNFDGLPIFLRIGENDYLRWNRLLPSIEKKLSNAGANVNAKLMPGEKHIFAIDWGELQPWLESIR